MGWSRLCDGERQTGRHTVGIEGSCGAGKGGVVTKEERLMCAQGAMVEVACFRTLVSAVEE